MTGKKVKTLDGERVAVESLNLGKPGDEGTAGFFRKLLRNINLFVAGMYTGVGCSGTPHSHHEYSQDDEIDRRPL